MIQEYEKGAHCMPPCCFLPHSYKLGPTSVIGIICGTRKKDVMTDIRPFLSVIKDELAHLPVHGARVYDGHKKEQACCHHV